MCKNLKIKFQIQFFLLENSKNALENYENYPKTEECKKKKYLFDST